MGTTNGYYLLWSILLGTSHGWGLLAIVALADHLAVRTQI